MMSSLFRKAQCVLLILLGIVSTFAQSVPPPPENPESGGIGGYPASPIDAYTSILFFAGLILIVMIAFKLKVKSA